MNKETFDGEKARLNSSIYYHTKQGNKDMVQALTTEFCMLYINNNVVPRKSFKYYDLWSSLAKAVTAHNEDVPLEEEVLGVKDILSKSDIRYIKKYMSNPNYQYDIKKETLMEDYKIDEETLMEWFQDLDIHIGSTQFERAKFHTVKKSKRYIISSAQTASPVNKVFLSNLEAYAEFIGAEIAIIATRYRNPTSIWKEEGDVWDSAVHPYLTARRQQLHKNLVLVGDLKIQATSINPTGRLETLEGNKSCIVGSPCVEFTPIATLPEQEQKFIMSTGSVTEASFTDTVAGGKAAELHRYGFVIVEIENDDVVHFRNVVAESDGTFNDLIYRVEKQQVSDEDVGTLVWGDSHFAQKVQEVTDAFRGMCTDLGITKSVLHDVWDSKNLNVHNTKDPITQHKLLKDPQNTLEKEFEQLLEELEWFDDNMHETIVVRSNHDDMLDRAMSHGDWRNNLQNAELFVEFLYITLTGRAPKGLIPFIIDRNLEKVRALGIEESYIQNGVQLALHGHKGMSGSRGSLNQFSKLITPNIVGHSHAPHIKGNTYQVGVSCSLHHGYNEGLSKWAYASVTLNARGARQLIVLNKNTLTYTTLY